MTREHGPIIKDDATYEALRQDGASKETATRIANARANPAMHPSHKGGKALPYEEWTKADLYARAKEIEIDGRSRMDRDGLIGALRKK